jgi:transmembrane sensor
MKKYLSFSVPEFINDPFFQDWVLQPDQTKDDFWNELIYQHPQLQAKIEEAKRILQEIEFVEYFPDEERIEQSVAVLRKKLDESGKPFSVIRMWTPLRVAAAAAVFLLIFSSIYLFMQNNASDNPTDAIVTKQAGKIIPGGNKATLTLVDGTVVQLDSTGTAIIANQGNSSIKTMNGQLAYSTNGGTAGSEVVFNTIHTPKGGQFQITLADGTNVWLNSASSLRYPTVFAEGNRVVELTGEGYFEVAPNAKQPFLVKVNDMEVAVLGTHFNINSYSDEPSVKTTLLEGKVKVTRADNYILLNPGQQAVVSPFGNKVSIDNNVDLEEVVAWKNGRFLFNGADVEAIMRQVARWYDVEIVYEQKINEPITGGLGRSENVQQLLNILEATGKVKFLVNGKQIVVKGN